MGGDVTEPGKDATDAELASYYEQHRDAVWGEPEPVQRAERMEVTISVRFTPAEISAIRTRAEAAGRKLTAYIRQCALETEERPIDRRRLSQSVAALSRDLEDLRQAAG
jgi:hypothetical protein